MSTKTINGRASTIKRLLKWFGVSMSIVYIIVAIVIIGDGKSVFNIPTQYSWAIGIMLIMYGVYRGYRSYLKDKE